MFEKVQYYETVISLVTTDLGLWYLVGGGWQGAFYYEAQGAVEGSRYFFFIFQLLGHGHGGVQEPRGGLLLSRL